MGTLNGNETWKPGPKEPVEIHATTIAVAVAASNAIGGAGTGARQPIEFTATNQAEKVAIEALMPGGLMAGDMAFLADTKWWETYTPAGWKVTKTLVPIAYSPAWLGAPYLTKGNGSDSFWYHVDGDTIDVFGAFSFGSTTTMGSATSQFIPLPFPGSKTLVAAGANIEIGKCMSNDASGFRWHGSVHARFDGTNMVVVNDFDANNTTGGLHTNMQTGVPMAWVTSCSFHLAFSYRRA